MSKLVESGHVVAMVPPAASCAGTEIPVCMKQYSHATIIISVDNGNTVTGTTVTMKEGTAVGAVGAMTGEQALAFSTVWANTDTEANDTLTKTTVTSNTFTTDTTNAKNLLYVIEIDAEDLDTADNYDCLRVDVTGNANSVVSAVCVLSGLRYGGGLPRVSAITD